VTQQSVNCRYFHGDYFRGKNKESCRLLEANPDNERPWRRALCNSCPVPEVVATTNSLELALEAEVKRKFLREAVEITFAICTKHMLELANPRHCPACAKDDAQLASVLGEL